MIATILAARRRAAALVCCSVLCAAGYPGAVRSYPVGPLPDCPDRGVQRVETRLRYGPMQTCGSGISVPAAGVTLHTPTNRCPLFVIIEPLHFEQIAKAGFFTTQVTPVPMTMVSFVCSTRWLFGFLPIPIGSRCEVSSSKNIGLIPNFVEGRCAVVEGVVGAATTAPGNR